MEYIFYGFLFITFAAYMVYMATGVKANYDISAFIKDANKQLKNKNNEVQANDK